MAGSIKTVDEKAFAFGVIKNEGKRDSFNGYASFLLIFPIVTVVIILVQILVLVLLVLYILF